MPGVVKGRGPLLGFLGLLGLAAKDMDKQKSVCKLVVNTRINTGCMHLHICSGNHETDILVIPSDDVGVDSANILSVDVEVHIGTVVSQDLKYVENELLSNTSISGGGQIM